MDGTKDIYVPHEVQVLRPNFVPSEALLKAVGQLLESDAQASLVKFYGSKEVTLDPIETGASHFDLAVAAANKRLAANSDPILFSGIVIGGPLRDPSTGREVVRLAMPPLSQEYFNTVVNTIDRAELPNLIPQRPNAPHYPYIELRPDQLPGDKVERLKRLAQLQAQLASHALFLRPAQYIKRHEARWDKISQIQSSRLSFPNLEERSA